MKHARQPAWSLLFGPLAVGALIGTAPAQEVAPGDPLPLRRVVIPLERVPLEVQRARPGVLVQLPRADFEAKVAAARKAQDAAKLAPRLVKAAYSAELSATALVSGSGVWTVQHPGPTPGVLPLPHFNLALSKIKLGGADAVLGDLDGKSLSLLVPAGATPPGATPGGPTPAGPTLAGATHDVVFDWSLRGQPRPDGIAFQFRVPSCPITVLELKVPEDHVLVAEKSAGLVSGPLDAGKPGTKVWRLQTSGQSQFDVLIRRHSPPGAPRMLFALAETKQHIGPSVVYADFDFRLEAVRGAVADLRLEGDGVLEPYEVTARGAEVAVWRTERLPGDAKTPPRIAVDVQLREPVVGAGAILRVRCLAQRDPKQEWRSPHLRIRDAVTRGETLHLEVPPPLQIERFEAGQFRLSHTATDATGSQTIRLIDGDTGSAAPQRPRLFTAGASGGLHVRQETRWTVGPSEMTLAADLECSLQRGQLYQLNVRMPTGGWIVEHVLAEPAEALQAWMAAGPMLVIDLKRGFDARQSVRLSIRWRFGWGGGGPPQALALPHVALVEAHTRSAHYEIQVDPLLETGLINSSLPPAAGAVPAGGEPAKVAAYAFDYRDQTLTGTLRLRSQRAAVTARSRQHVVLEARRLVTTAQIDLEPISGQPESIDLFIAGAGGPLLGAGRWTARDAAANGLDNAAENVTGKSLYRLERRAGVECTAPLLLLAAIRPWDVLPVYPVLPHGETWRLTLPERLHKPASIVLRGEVATPPTLDAALIARLARPGLSLEHVVTDLMHLSTRGAAALWRDIPVASVPSADYFQGHVVVEHSGNVVAAQQVRGLTTEPVPAARGATAAFRTGAGDPWPALRLALRATHVAATPPRPIEELHVTHYVTHQGQVYHHVQMHLRGWSGRYVPVRFADPTVKVLAARLDGHWLDRLRPAPEAGGSYLLPVPSDDRSHTVELVLVHDDAGAGWAPLRAPTAVEPEAAAPVLRKRHVWRLAEGWAPLRQETLHSLDRGLGAPARWLRPLWRAADSWVRPLAPTTEPAAEAPTRLVRRAEAVIHPQLTGETRLAEAMQRLIFDGFKDAAEPTRIVVDRLALQSLGLSPETNLSAALAAGRPFWEGLGLVERPAADAVVLTCAECWPTSPVPPGLRQAAAQAATAGQDAGGRFCRADFWLRHDGAGAAPASIAWPAFLPGGLGAGWTEWEPTAPAHPPAKLTIVRVAAIRWLGLASAAVLLLVFAALARRLRAPMALRFFILAVVALGFALFAFPETLGELAFWPLLAALVYLTLSWRRCTRSGSADRSRAPSKRGGAVAGVLLLLTLGGWGGFDVGPARGQPENGDSFTVFYIDRGVDGHFALVRPELLKRLDDLERQATTPTHGAVLVAAAYTGTWQGSAARLEAQFELYCFAERSTVHLPLAGVELLEGALLDGAPAYPTAAAGKPGFALAVEGQGFHRLTLPLLVRAKNLGDQAEVRCGIPALALSRLTWRGPATQTNVHVVQSAGDVRTAPAATGQQEVRAQLGRENVLHLRWQTSTTPAAVAGHEVREAYWWDLDDQAPALTALLRYVPSKASLSRLELALPGALEIRAVDILTGGDPPATPRLRGWQVVGKGSQRRLAVELEAPASTPFTVQLLAVPQLAPATRQISLALPLPLAAKVVDGALAYRLPAYQAADKTKNLGVTVLPLDVFAKFWAQLGGDATAPTTRAYSFSRAGPGASLDLALQAQQPQAQLDLVWRIEPPQAELVAQVQLTSSAETQLVELALPAPLQVTRVHGPMVHHWSLHSARLQVWLRTPSKQPSFHVEGRMPNALAKDVFALPKLEVTGADGLATTVRLAPSAGWLIEPQTLRGLRPVPDAGGVAYQLDQAAAVGAWRLRPGPAQVEAAALTWVEPRGDVLAVTTAIHATARHGRLPALAVRLQGWTADTRLESSAPAARQGHQRLGNDQRWTVELAPGAHQVTLHLRSYVPRTTAIALPAIQMEGAVLREHALGLPKDLVRIVRAKGLSPNRDRPTWGRAPAAKDDLAWWRAEPAAWECLVDAPPAAPTAGLRILQAEQHAALTDGQRWLHHAQYLVLAHAARALPLTLPPGAAFLAVHVEERLVNAVVAGRALTIPLPQSAAPLRVMVQWRYADEHESVARPDLAAPLLPPGSAAPVTGVLWLPGGRAASGPAKLVAGEAPLLLARLEAAVEASKGDQANVSWLERERVVRGLRRHLDYLLRLEAAPGRSELAQRLARLDKGIRTGDPAGEFAPALGRLDAWSPRRGVPQVWRSETGAAPQVVVVSMSDAALEDWSHELVALALVGLFLLSWLPGGITWMRHAWPELLAGFTLVACLAWGWTILGGAILGVALIARLAALVRLLGAPAATTAPSAAGSKV